MSNSKHTPGPYYRDLTLRRVTDLKSDELVSIVNKDRNELYLGDGLYAKFDGWNFWLRTSRETGEHFVALEPEALAGLFAFVRHARPDLVSIGGWERKARG